MMEFKGTPGPWSPGHCTNREMTNVSSETHRIAEIKHYSVQVDDRLIEPSFIEGRANAKLIAAAPDLLEALQWLTYLHSCEQEGLWSGMPTFKDWLDATNKANDAIQKALS